MRKSLIFIIFLFASCVNNDKYKVNQYIKKESGNTKITTEVVKFENGAWLGTSIYSSVIETNSIDSVEIYMVSEIERATSFKDKISELKK
jgi:hypothetical protein